MPKNSRGGKAGAATAPRYHNPGTPITFTSAGAPAGFTVAQQTVQAQALHFQPATKKQQQQIQSTQTANLQGQDVMTRYAVSQYIRSDTQANGKSRSQNLNQKLETDGKLDPTERTMVRGLDKAMSPIGQNVQLVRADHALTPQGSGLMDKLGLKNYQSLTPAQLQQQLVGKTWTEKKYLSTSYNVKNNPFIHGTKAGGRAVIMKINAGANTRMVLGDVTQSEYILARGGNYRITGARYTGKTVYPASGGSYRQIEIDVDII